VNHSAARIPAMTSNAIRAGSNHFGSN
jgi:hypothetical protein